jgi:DUF1680 family protein
VNNGKIMINRTRTLTIIKILIMLWVLPGCMSKDMDDKNIFAIERFDISEVTLMDGRFQKAQERDMRYLLELEPDRLLHFFRITSGLPSASTSYGGWEQEGIEVRGQSMGHYLSALAKMYAATRNTELLQRSQYSVNAISECQDAFGLSGYCMAFPETHFDRLERGENVWAPYYVFHKLLAGMIDQYNYTGNPLALEIAEKLAQWVKGRTDNLDEAKMQMILANEHGGMVEAFVRLYSVTNDSVYLILAKRFEHNEIINPLALNEDVLLGRHANTQVPKIFGSAMEYEVTGDEFYKKAAENGWGLIADGRTYVFGGFSNYEFFLRPPHFLSDQLSVESAESCCTHNLLKLADRLITWSGDPQYGDYIERALVNHILASQEPETGMFMYYMALKAGHWKVYSTPDSSFWCCVGSGMENHAEYGRSIYYRKGRDVYINLFIASRLDLAGRGVITQNTTFPEEERSMITMTLKKPEEFGLFIRVPWWAGSGFRIKVNGIYEDFMFLPSTWARIERKWHNGDVVELEFPFTLTVHRMPDDPSIFALMNGPLVLAGDLGHDGLTDKHRYLKNQRGMHRHCAPEIIIPVFKPGKRVIEDALQPVQGSFSTFNTGNITDPSGVLLKPYNKIVKERYTIYFKQVDYDPIKKPWNLD